MFFQPGRIHLRFVQIQYRLGNVPDFWCGWKLQRSGVTSASGFCDSGFVGDRKEEAGAVLAA